MPKGNGRVLSSREQPGNSCGVSTHRNTGFFFADAAVGYGGSTAISTLPSGPGPGPLPPLWVCRRPTLPPVKDHPRHRLVRHVPAVGLSGDVPATGRGDLRAVAGLVQNPKRSNKYTTNWGILFSEPSSVWVFCAKLVYPIFLSFSKKKPSKTNFLEINVAF